MGIRNWLDRKSKIGPEIVGMSAGGASLIKYGSRELDKNAVRFEEPNEELAHRREALYGELFGVIEIVHHELLILVPHIDVYQIAPTENRPFYTFVTGGMSDLPMAAPKKARPEYRRVELVFYADSANAEYPNLLQHLAHFPHDNHSWLHWGHTMPNGNPPHPLFTTSTLDTLYFTASIVTPDNRLGQRLSWKNEAIHLVWVVPISTAECGLALQKGSDSLLDLFERVNHPFVFTGDRKSYVQEPLTN